MQSIDIDIISMQKTTLPVVPERLVKKWEEIRDKVHKMHPSKSFITEHRNIEIMEPYIFINVNISPRVYKYLQKLYKLRLEDGQYHKYCGELKIIINNFLNYWSDVINECIKEADTLLNTLDKKGVLQLVQTSIEIQKFKQKHYLEEFGPPENDEEKELLDYMNQKSEWQLEGLDIMGSFVQKMDLKVFVLDFLSHHLNLSILKKNEVFELLHDWIAQHLAKYLKNNLKKLEEERAETLSGYMDELYEAHKDRLLVLRQELHNLHRALETAQVEHVINKINTKIERHHLEEPLAKVKEEVQYWTKRTEEFRNLETTIRKIETELSNVTEYLERYNKMSTTEHPGSKKTCWETMGENYRRRKAYLEKILTEASKAIMTFFAVQGQNFIYYKDNVGLYYIDQYGHQNYVFDQGQKTFHITCDKKFVKVLDTDKYYYDTVGRYILDEDGNKVHQRAACSSTYNLNEHNLLVKTTKDCGHSETPNPTCGLTIKDPNYVEMLPAVDPVDIKQTLTPETSEYLWHGLAYPLADALCDTGNKQSRNPIYCLANRLIYHKYHKNTIAQLEKKVQESDNYKADIYKRRKDKAVAEAKAYKALQIKPRKPEESEDAQLRLLWTQTQQQANQVNYDDN